MVVYSTGLGGFFGARPGGDVHANGAGTTPATGVGTPSATDPATGTGAPATDPQAATPRPGIPVYGLQVASFRTAGRATRVLHDYVETTGLPGEVLLSDVDGDTWYRIVLGRFADEQTARAASEDLLGRSLIAEGIVIPYTPQAP
jgi:septal ring-binding cell division protein DamX